MDEPGAHELTELLLAWGDGDEAALARIAPLVHAELYRLAPSEGAVSISKCNS